MFHTRFNAQLNILTSYQIAEGVIGAERKEVRINRIESNSNLIEKYTQIDQGAILFKAFSLFQRPKFEHVRNEFLAVHDHNTPLSYIIPLT